MEGVRRSSFDESSLTASALRRWTSNSPPGHRLPGPRRSATGSTASASLAALESDKQAPCVARETASGDCAFHSFIVWAAVKRNSCPRMTPEEKTECPFLRCRLRFPSHELLLQHIYSCEHLALGEYWCYDCGRLEQLNDVKCRRCLGHPSKRKRMVSMAKSFFSSLGHKPKNRARPDLDLDAGEAPPSCEPPEAELESNEIHEIDSCLPTIPEAREGPEPEPFAAYLSNLSSLSAAAPPPSPLVTLGSAHSGFDESLINWEPSPSPPPPVAPGGPSRPASVTAPERPVLQLNTHGLGHYQARVRRWGKRLTPSASVRSTASTASTNSTSSTTSHNISPMSAWSGAWSRAPELESTLTSPADDLSDLAGLFPRLDKGDRWHETDNHKSDLAGIAVDNLLPELPAEVPMLDLLQANKTLPGDMGSGRLDMPLNAPTLAPMDARLASTGSPHVSQVPAQLVADPTRNQSVGTPSLVQTAQRMLEEHVADSIGKLGNSEQNTLASQFRRLSAESVAAAGLETMADVLEGRRASSPVKLLCFVHVVYSLCLMVHEQDAPRRCKDLFVQAVACSSWLSPRDRQAYVQVVDLLWHPGDTADGDLTVLVEAVSRKGKEIAEMSDTCQTDPLVFVTQYFLDELEDSTLRDTQRPEIQASGLCIEHLNDANLVVHEGSPFSIAAHSAAGLLCQQFRGVPELESAVQHVLGRVKSNHVATPRRLELDLMQAGKMRLAPDVFFDQYIPLVRKQSDSLYQLIVPGAADDGGRLRYYRKGIRLMGLLARQPEADEAVVPDALAGGAMLGPLGLGGRTTPSMGGFAFGSMPDAGFGAPPGAAAAVSDAAVPSMTTSPAPPGRAAWFRAPGAPASPGLEARVVPPPKMLSNSSCEICGYRPKGDPKWFVSSLNKHRKMQHGPPKTYRCPFPGCTSQYKSRRDNLRQHQMVKGHFVDGEDAASGPRPSKRRRTE